MMHLLLSLIMTSAFAGRVVILSDIHVYPNTKVHSNFIDLVPCLPALKPSAVLIIGDSTNGNPRDGASLEIAASWWTKLKQTLKPLRDAGIAILPVAGNHDYYTSAQQRAYEDAWKSLASDAAPLTLKGKPPLYYSFDLENAHFTMAHIPFPAPVPKNVAEWVAEDLRDARGAKFRFAFGHAPLISRLGKTTWDLANPMGEIFARGKLTAYVAGHEHLSWDETFSFAGLPLRQVTVGTASASYFYPLTREAYAAGHCRGVRCYMPFDQREFALDSPASRQQTDKQAFAILNVKDSAYSIELMAFRPKRALHSRGPTADLPSTCNGEIVPFGAP